MRLFKSIYLALVVIFSGCGFSRSPESVTLSDPKIAPMLKALDDIDRASMGFTPIPTSAVVTLEMIDREHWDKEYPPPIYDAMLHLYADTHRTIGFVKTTDGYRWISEQELHYGPKMFMTVDGELQEYITIEYQLEPVNGVPIKQVYISYSGEDARLVDRSNLTLTFIQPILAKWKGTKIR